MLAAATRALERLGAEVRLFPDAENCVRFAVFHAGRASAADPRATFHLQR